MNFLKEIRHHLKEFESTSSDEIHRFIDFLHSKYEPVGPAVVAPPAPIGQPDASTFTAPVVDPTPAPVVETTSEPVAEVVAEPVIEPVVEVTPEPVVEDTVVEKITNSKSAK